MNQPVLQGGEGMNPKDVTNRPRDRRLEERRKRTARQKWGQRRFQLSDGALTAVAIIMGLAAMYLWVYGR